ncbi:DNA mismatch repair protein [Modicella reniformis]|uniref:DNA mismatch repair protein n=1 Tax=Modicella reniformis TaxID=1440133 RepID=A0A9P6JK90_9FUNG|nr:DNA mismatch repair protein [Modicella reniformis]
MALTAPRVSFTVIDMAKDIKVLSCRKVDSQLHRITAVLGQSLASSLTFVRSSPDETTYSFSGYISTVGHYNRLYQYIFLNNRPIKWDELHKAITVLFQQSSFSKDSLHYDEDVRRNRERHPVFVLKLKCPASTYDICVDPSKATVQLEDEERVLQVVRDTIISFLVQQHLLSRSVASTLRNRTTIKKRKSRARGPIGGHSSEAISLGHFPHVKTSRPSRAAKLPRHDSRNDKECHGQIEMDIEEELEFELDIDWMAPMLDDDFVMNEEISAARRWFAHKAIQHWNIRNLGTGCTSKMGQPCIPNSTQADPITENNKPGCFEGIWAGRVRKGVY